MNKTNKEFRMNRATEFIIALLNVFAFVSLRQRPPLSLSLSFFWKYALNTKLFMLCIFNKDDFP